MFEDNIRFDERLGVGAGTLWGSAEEVGLPASALEHGHKLQFQPGLVVFHKDSFPRDREAGLQKAYRYGCGMGFVLRKRHYPPDFMAIAIVRSTASALRAIFSGDVYKARFMSAMVRGRLAVCLRSPAAQARGIVS